MSDGGDPLATWRQKALSAVVVLLVVAFGTRIAADALEPVIPVLVAVVVLAVAGRVLFGLKRK